VTASDSPLATAEPVPAALAPAASDEDLATDSDEPAAASEADEPAEGAGPEAAGGPPAGVPIRRRAALATVVALVVLLAVLAGALALNYHRARVRAAAEVAALGPAKTAAARILSYDYRRIDQDATQASAVLTGVFKGQYEAVMRQQIVPQAPKQRAVVQAEVLAAGVTSVSPDGAQVVVLIFANQTVSNTSSAQPRVDQVRVRLTLDRVGGAWLVSKVDAL
jgi:Mce-associated membrane protein